MGNKYIDTDNTWVELKDQYEDTISNYSTRIQQKYQAQHFWYSTNTGQYNPSNYTYTPWVTTITNTNTFNGPIVSSMIVRFGFFIPLPRKKEIISIDVFEKNV